MTRILATLISLLALTWMAQAAAVGGWVYDATGDVTIVVGKLPASKAFKNTEIASDTFITTGDNSTAVLKFEDGQVISMQANSTLKVRRYHYQPQNADKSSAFFTALKGGMRFISGLIGKGNKSAFKLTTPSSTIGIRGTDFMTVINGQSVYSQVVAGDIDLTNKAGTLALGAGQTAMVTSSTAIATLVSAAALPAGLFSQIASIPVPPATPAVAPTPPASPTTTPAMPASPATPIAPTVPTLPAAPSAPMAPVLVPAVIAPVSVIPAVIAPAATEDEEDCDADDAEDCVSEVIEECDPEEDEDCDPEEDEDE
ncbi:MAG: FecR family protein [Gallionella sp.]|nr:FecR family protein [Gallionella sp.]